MFHKQIHLGNANPEVIFLKKYKPTKKSKRFNQTEPMDMVEELNAVSATDFTGLVPTIPDSYSEENYEDIIPQGFPQSQG